MSSTGNRRSANIEERKLSDVLEDHEKISTSTALSPRAYTFGGRKISNKKFGSGDSGGGGSVGLSLNMNSFVSTSTGELFF